MTDLEGHYERLLFRSRAEKAELQARLEACETLVRSLADGSLPWTSADHAARALVEEMDGPERTPGSQKPLSETLAAALEKDSSERTSAPRDNSKRCSHKYETDWECGGCGLYLGSRPSPDFGEHPCVCGRNNRPRPVAPTSFNHPSQKGKRRK